MNLRGYFLLRERLSISTVFDYTTRWRSGKFCKYFFFNDTATTEIYTLSLHDALPILDSGSMTAAAEALSYTTSAVSQQLSRDRKSTRLNSSHANISYAVFCLKKKTR